MKVTIQNWKTGDGVIMTLYTSSILTFSLATLLLYGILWVFESYNKPALSAGIGIILFIAIIYSSILDYQNKKKQAEDLSAYVIENNCKLVDFGRHTEVHKQKDKWELDLKGTTTWDCSGARVEIHK